uniref:Uncharacterized protein n=1 Tax=Trypanosoma congolense (strain IL3000) TaxID=1068625 RepID=F9WET2_TRYCI|nr:hypothetical protein, unlikely [Trypanosoma congolense IL3000]
MDELNELKQIKTTANAAMPLLLSSFFFTPSLTHSSSPRVSFEECVCVARCALGSVVSRSFISSCFSVSFSFACTLLRESKQTHTFDRFSSFLTVIIMIIKAKNLCALFSIFSNICFSVLLIFSFTPFRSATHFITLYTHSFRRR